MDGFWFAHLLLWIALAGSVAVALRPARWLDLGSLAATSLAWAAFTAGLIARGLNAGHWPLTNRYEFALCFVWATLGVHLLQRGLWRDAYAAGRSGAVENATVLGVVLAVAVYAATRPEAERAIHPLLPALRSVWLQVHVTSAAIGYGACGVAAGLALPQLLRARRANNNNKRPSPDQDAERAVERSVAWGLPWLTLSILSGAIWAQEAWGRYWGWDPKETWALITWLWYLLFLHLRDLRSWRGARLAAWAVAGFLLIFFAFAGLPWLLRTVRLTTLHGF